MLMITMIYESDLLATNDSNDKVYDIIVISSPLMLSNSVNNSSDKSI